MRNATIWILALVLAACSAEDWNWNLPRTNPVDPAVNTGATLPVTLSAKRSELVTFVVNPNVSFALGENFSLAFGIDYIHADVKEFSHMTDVNPAPDQVTLDESNLTGSGVDWGWNDQPVTLDGAQASTEKVTS